MNDDYLKDFGNLLGISSKYFNTNSNPNVWSSLNFNSPPITTVKVDYSDLNKVQTGGVSRKSLEDWLNENPDSNEDMELVAEYLRKRLEKVMENPDLILKIKLLETIEKEHLIERLRYSESTITVLENKIKKLEDKLDYLQKLVDNEILCGDSF